MKCLASLMRSGLGHAIRSFATIAVLGAFVLLSCGGEDRAGLGTPTSPSPTPSSETGSSTSPTSQPATGTVTLRGDGLGVVDFGQNTDEVVVALEELIGSSPTATGSGAEWVEFVGWADLGLFVGFDTPAALDYSGASRFIGWEYFGSNGGTTLMTAEGASIGTALPELQTLYGDRLEVSTAIDECAGTGYPIVLDGNIHGMLDRAPGDDARVSILRAGVGVGC